MSPLSLVNSLGWGYIRRWTGSFWGGGTNQIKGPQKPEPQSHAVPSPILLSEEQALQLSVVWACAKILTDNIATLPLTLYERQGDKGDDRKPAKNHPLYRLLVRRPNKRMTATEFKQAMVLNLVLHGNCYARIDRNKVGQIISLWPLSSLQVDTVVLANGDVIYIRRYDNNVEAIAAENIFHVKLMGNGTIGMAPLAYARSSLGLAAAAEEYSTNFYVHGAKPGGVLTLDKVLTKSQREELRASFKDLIEGRAHAHQLFVLEANMKYQQVQISPEDAQMLQTRRFQIEELCRYFGVPSFLVNDTEKTTTWGSGIEQMMIGFYTLTVRPYLKIFEDAINVWLIDEAEQDRMFVEFNFDALLRADTMARAELFSKYVQNGIMTRNEVRRKENLPPIPGGDELTAQVNLVPLQMLGRQNDVTQRIAA